MLLTRRALLASVAAALVVGAAPLGALVAEQGLRLWEVGELPCGETHWVTAPSPAVALRLLAAPLRWRGNAHLGDLAVICQENGCDSVEVVPLDDDQMLVVWDDNEGTEVAQPAKAWCVGSPSVVASTCW